MRILKQSLALVALGSLLVVAPSAAQQAGTSPFKWYVGGQGGVTSFRTNAGGRELMPVAGGHILITAKRTGSAALRRPGLRLGRAHADAVRGPRCRQRDGPVRRQQLDLPGHSPVLGHPDGLPDPEREHSALRRRRWRHRPHHGELRRAVRRRQHRERPEQHRLRHRRGGPGIPGGPAQRLRPVSDHHQAGVQAGDNELQATALRPGSTTASGPWAPSTRSPAAFASAWAARVRTAAPAGTERAQRRRTTAKRAADPRSAARFALRAPRSSLRPRWPRDTQGEPSTTNRSGQSAALVMPIRGVTAIAAGGSPARARTIAPERRIGRPSWSRVIAERLAELARARSRAGGRPRPPRRSPHRREPLHRLERAEQHRARLARRRRRPGWRTSACRRRDRRTRCPADRTAPRSARAGGGGSRARPGRRSPGRPRSRRSGRRSGRRPAWRPPSRRAARARPARRAGRKTRRAAWLPVAVVLTPPSSWLALAVASRGVRPAPRRLRPRERRRRRRRRRGLLPRRPRPRPASAGRARSPRPAPPASATAAAGSGRRVHLHDADERDLARPERRRGSRGGSGGRAAGRCRSGPARAGIGRGAGDAASSSVSAGGRRGAAAARRRDGRHAGGPVRRDLVLVLAHLPHVGDLGVVGLPEQPGEPGGLEQRILPAVQRHHAEPERLVRHRGAELARAPGS